MEKMDGMSMDLKAENIAQLKALFPEAVTEGKVDFEVLKALLGGEIEQRQEYYKFTWNGKEAARAYARTRSMGTLRPCVEESSGKDGTPGKFDSDNLYIEGDNLEVLKLLQGPYHKKVKMIYIDPPYNTGHDFVYPDNFKDSIGNYKALTGQTDDEGKSTRANPETSGRYHTDWLNMMYPRLILARNLLTDDGVIFISIDDSEQDNLKKLCNEVFGEENFSTQFLWTKTSTPPALSHKCRKTVEYVVCYEKNANNSRYFGSFLDGGDAPLLNTGNPIKELIFPPKSVKFYFTNEGIISKGTKEKVELLDDILISKGTNENEFRARAEFKWGQQTLEDEVAQGTYFLVKTEKLSIRFQRPHLENDFKTPNNFLNLELNKEIGIGTNESAVKELNQLSLANCFDFPKPSSLLKYIVNMICKFDKDAIILDFFSGSATTAHAIQQLNAEDGGNRKYIMVQLPEVCEAGTEAAKAGYANICEIGKERIRRAAKKVVSDKWEVISKEEKAKYGCKELSRSDCLAKGNECGNNDLFSGEKTAERGTVCAVGSNAAGGGIHSLQHSGGTSTELNQGISAISGNSTGEQGRTGNATPSLRPSELPCPYGHFGSHGATSGSGQDAPCPYKNTNHCPLITKYCSDMGFKVFKLDTSNLLPWNPNADELEQNLFAAVDNVLEGRTTDDLLHEILLKCNLPLTLPIETKQCGSNTIYLVGAGALAICLDKNIPATIAEEIVRLRDEYAPIVPMQVVFRDNGFNDVTKTNALQILKQAGFEEKSIQTI